MQVRCPFCKQLFLAPLAAKQTLVATQLQTPNLSPPSMPACSGPVIRLEDEVTAAASPDPIKRVIRPRLRVALALAGTIVCGVAVAAFLMLYPGPDDTTDDHTPPADMGGHVSATWKDYVSEEERFVVAFPGEPERTQDDKDPKVKRFSLALPKEDIGFFVHVRETADLPRERKGLPHEIDVHVLIKFAQGGVPKASDIKSGWEQHVDGFRYYQVTMTFPGGEHMRRWVINTKDRLYMLSVSSSRLESFEAEAKKFLDSFEMLPPGANVAQVLARRRAGDKLSFDESGKVVLKGAKNADDLAFSSDNTRLLAGDSHKVVVWDIKALTRLKDVEAEVPPGRSSKVGTVTFPHARVVAVALSRNGRFYAVIDSFHKLRVLDIEKKETQASDLTLATVEDMPWRPKSMVISPEGGRVHVLKSQLDINHWSVPDLEPLKGYSIGENSFRWGPYDQPFRETPVLSADGAYAAWPEREDSLGVRIFKTGSGEEVGRKTFPKLRPFYSWNGTEPGRPGVQVIARIHLAFSPDGSVLAMSSPDRCIRLLDPRSGEEKSRLELLTATGIAFHPNGKLLAVCNVETKAIEFWDVQTKKIAASIDTKEESILRGPYLSHDGRFLAVINAQRHIILWDASRYLKKE